MRRISSVIAAVLAVFVISAAVLANVNGAVFTTVADGTTVNGNIYESKESVYLGGGPQNENNAGLSPGGLYYFQVTDPSGAVLLSTDTIGCRVLVVSNGRIAGVEPGACAHAEGDPNGASGITPVQLMPYADTPNPGGEYKVWLTPVERYGVSCAANQGSFGFCDAWSKTDNFKVKASAPLAAQISVCKFNDYDANGVQDVSEPLIAHWPITATGVDGGTVTSQTGDDGCAMFSVSDLGADKISQTVTLTEGSFGPDWSQTAPATCGSTPGCSIDGGVITLIVGPGAIVAAPNFGNTNPYCQDGCNGGDPISTATAFSSFARTFDWTIAKSVDQAVIKTASLQATANYSVTLSHDAGTETDWGLAGMIRVANPGGIAISGLTVTAAAGTDGVCTVTGGEQAAIAAGSHVDFAYRCAFPALPTAGHVNVSVASAAHQLTTSAPFDFATAAINNVDGEAVVTDSMVGELGRVSAGTPSPITFNYASAVSGQAGTCTVTNNVASFTTDTSATMGEASQTVKVCVGASLDASAWAETSRQSGITKAVDRAVVQQQGGSVTFNYTITVSESAWRVAGVVAVSNPNDWQDVAAAVAVTVPGAVCTVSTPSVNLPASSSVDVPYSCEFAAAPPVSVTATVTITWDAAAASTASGSTQAAATAAFAPLTVLDAFNGGAASTIGTVSTPAAVTAIANARTVTNASPGQCESFTNVASIAGSGQSASQTAYACNTLSGARTIGFWHNKNGQGIITGGAAPSGVCASAVWLRQFTPFQNLAATASCKTVASYAMTIIKSASAAGASMNAMLKAQMLASALDVFFSDASLGGNALAAPVAVGSVRIDLTGRGVAFGNNASLTALQMLAWQNGVSNAGGSAWYGNVKAVQELAKTAFDQINNEIAPIAR